MKTVTTTLTGNQNQYIVTVDHDGIITSFVTTPDINNRNIAVYQNGINSNTDMLDTSGQVNAQILGQFSGVNTAQYEFKIDSKYGDVSAYFTSGKNIALESNLMDLTDPENPVPYPILETTCNSGYYSQDGVDEYGIPIYTTKVSVNAPMGIDYHKISYQI